MRGLDARRRDRARERDEGILQPLAARAGARDLFGRHVHETRDFRVGDLALARRDLIDSGREGRGIRDALARQALEENRARVVRDEEALHLFGRMRAPPADDAHGHSRRRRHVPDRRHRARAPGDRHLLPGRGIHLLEIENPVDVGPHARRQRRPDHRRENRHVRLEARRVALRDQALPVRHPAFRRETVEQIPVEAVQTEPDDRRAVPRGSRRSDSRVRLIHGLAGRFRRRGRGGSLPRRLPTGEPAERPEQEGDGHDATPHSSGHHDFRSAASERMTAGWSALIASDRSK